MKMPLRPVPSPSKSRPRIVTKAFVGALTTNALVPDTRTPAVPPSQEIVIALVMVRPPKPPGSRQLISPPVAVFEMAPANVLQGAVRLHGLASSPTPDTQVRVACALAAVLRQSTANADPNIIFFMIEAPTWGVKCHLREHAAG